MDPIAQAEEEKRFKEEAELRELNETLMLDDTYFSSRDLAFKGKEVLPMGKHRKTVQTIAATLRFPSPAQRRKSISIDLYHQNTPEIDDDLPDVDLNAKPRVFVSSGPVNKKEPGKPSQSLNIVIPPLTSLPSQSYIDGILRKTSRKHLFVFTDVILLATKKEGVDMYDVTQVLWVKDLRLRYTLCAESEDDKFSFEFIVNRTRTRPRYTVTVLCENELSWRQWIEDIENTLLAYHRQTELSKQLGWFHEIIQGNFFSAAYLGDIALLRKYLKAINEKTFKSKISNNNADDAYQLPSSIDSLDKSGMSALHWAVMRGHEIIVRVLLDRGADTDVFQKGMNTPLLLAAAFGHETIARLLIENGADLRASNQKGHDAVFMAVLYGHATKGLPWVLQLLNARGMNLNEVDSAGATPLHLCAEKKLARPVRMLVDSGADVNVRHGETQFTPLQMACNHPHPDVETVRSFLDKGAYPNWKDNQGRTAFDLALKNQPNNRPLAPSTPVVFGPNNGNDVNVNDVLTSSSSKSVTNNSGANNLVIPSEDAWRESTDSMSPKSSVTQGGGNGGVDGKWRAMEGTLSTVGDWAVRALPTLMELSKKGARFDVKEIDFLRPSFKAAIYEAKEVWEKKGEPSNFIEFVQVREQSGEDLMLHKAVWSKNNTSIICQLCSDAFSLTNRRHHCRACGVLCCDRCSTKRLHLAGENGSTILISNNNNPTVNTNNNNTGGGRDSWKLVGGGSDRKSFSTTVSGGSNKEESSERVCDGCFNRLCHEASQPSPDHFRVRQLKNCAEDLIHSIQQLVDSLEDPEGDPRSFQTSLRETMNLTKELDAFGKGGKGGGSGKAPALVTPSSFAQKNVGSPVPTTPTSPATSTFAAKSAEALIDVLRLRENRLYRTEDVMAKFLEAADGYHRISKRLIEQKLENSRLWGSNNSAV